MKLAHRLAYYSGGFIIGLIMLFFILSGKRTSCAYGPQSRTLKHLRLKERAFSEKSMQFFQQNQLDTSAVSTLLLEGRVNFSESNTRLDSCKQYVIEGEAFEKKLSIRMENCDDLVTVMSADFSE